MSDVKVDGIELNESEREAWEERVSICLFEGLVSVHQAEQIADDQIRKMRRERE